MMTFWKTVRRSTSRDRLYKHNPKWTRIGSVSMCDNTYTSWSCSRYRCGIKRKEVRISGYEGHWG